MNEAEEPFAEAAGWRNGEGRQLQERNMGAKLQAAFLTQALRWDPNNSEQSPVWLERQNKQLLVVEKNRRLPS